MDMEHGSKDSKLPGIIIDESREIKQSEAPAKLLDGSGQITHSKTPAKVPDGNEEIEQSKIHMNILDGIRESKQAETPEGSHGKGEIQKSETHEKVYDKSGKSSMQSEKLLKVLYGSEESNQSETHPEVHDETGESNQLETDAKVFDRSGESKQLETPLIVLDGHEESEQSKTLPEVSDGNEESTKQPETLPKGNDGMSYPPLQSKDIEATAKRSHRRAPSGTRQEVKGGHRRAPSVPRVNDGSGGSNYSSPPLPYKVVEASNAKGGHTRNQSDRLFSFTSTSSSGSDTSMDDLFQVDSSRFSSSSQIPPLPNSPYRSPTPRLSNVNPAETPPGIQMMDRYGGYDPYRIPSSVFDTNNLSNRDMEWSVASNESLFSLHIGNNSFSRDHVVMMGDLGQTKSGELFGIRTPRTPPPPVAASEIHRKEGRESAGEEMTDENIIKNTGLRASSAENHSEGIRVPPPIVSSPKSPSLAPSLAPSHRSDGSGISVASAKSFAFPILEDGKKNSLKLAQDSEEQRPVLIPIGTTKTRKKKKTRWFPCLSWCCCCKWSCGCSWCSCRRIFFCHRICSCRLCCSCPRCTRRLCCCF